MKTIKIILSAGSSRSGSTIMAVLIALVFIGIVTAAMLRNTGSQSSASVGYGTMQSAAVTTSSGIVATESFFRANVGNEALRRLNEFLAATTGTADETAKSFVLGGVRRKQGIGKEQFFSSKIIGYDRDASNFAAFEITSGKAERGRDLKKARAYYRVDNGRITGEVAFPGTNAFSATDNARLVNANSGLRTFGHVTITRGLSTQNQDVVEFLPDEETGEGSLYVKGYADIKNSSVINFGVNTFFEDSVKIQNITNTAAQSLFRGDVGFNANFATTRTVPIGVDGNVWINGDFRENGSKQTTFKFQANGPDAQTINYTENLSRLDPDDPPTLSQSCCPSIVSRLNGNGFLPQYPSDPNGRNFSSGCTPNGGVFALPIFDTLTGSGNLRYGASGRCVWRMPINPTTHPSNASSQTCTWTCATHNGLTADKHLTETEFQNRFTGFTEIKEYNPELPAGVDQNEAAVKANTISDMLTKLDMKPLEERKEPDININNIAEGKKFLDIFTTTQPNVYDVLASGGNLTGEKLQEFYDKTHNDPAYAKYYDNGHLLLTIPPNTNVATGGGVFNGKVIFDIKGSLNSGSGKFYSSDPTNQNASTLIYVDTTGKVSDFGVGANGNFSGLIYVDVNNRESSTFQWGSNTTLNGAVILKGGNLTWNSGANMTTIRRDPRVLRNYGFLLDSDNLDNQQVELINNSEGLIFSRAAYYFY